MLAGGSAQDPLAQKYGVASKAWIPYRGRPLVEYTLEALDQAGLAIILVGPQAPLRPLPKVFLPDQSSLLANLEAGVQAAKGERLLVATGDMPFLSVEAVRWVLQQAPEAGFVYTIIPRSTIEQRFPGMRRTYARVREGSFTGGNIAILDKQVFLTALPLLRRAIALRKRPLALASLIGWGTLFRVLTGRADIPGLEARVSQMIGGPARALITPFAEVGVDIDKEEDLRWLEAVN